MSRVGGGHDGGNGNGNGATAWWEHAAQHLGGAVPPTISGAVQEVLSWLWAQGLWAIFSGRGSSSSSSSSSSSTHHREAGDGADGALAVYAPTGLASFMSFLALPSSAVLALRLATSVALVLSLVAIGWVLAYRLLLNQIPVFRELFGGHHGKKPHAPQESRVYRQTQRELQRRQQQSIASRMDE